MANTGPKKVMTVVGARPQFLKAAMLSRSLREAAVPQSFSEIVVHTGQHYDFLMSDIFLQELEAQQPAYNLNVGSCPPATQITRMLDRLDVVVAKEVPDAMLVYGDTNSTIAAALCAMQRNIPLVHVEAGERLYRRWHVPEDWNRVVTDHIAYRCLTSTERARDHLLREGMCPERVTFVGDLVYDLFQWSVEHIRVLGVYKEFCGEPYLLATIHRAENTSDRSHTIALLEALDASKKRVVLPAHPRLKHLLQAWGWTPKRRLEIVEPLGYFEFLNALLHCDMCITDSGGVTREAFFARKPCIIPLVSSCWTDIVESGWAVATGTSAVELTNAMECFTPPEQAPEGLFGNGKSAARIIGAIIEVLEEPRSEWKWHRHGSVAVPLYEQSRTVGFNCAEYGREVRALQSSA